MRKIYLEGQLGQKFGTSHLFCGETTADAIRLIGANYPEFRKYLIECHEKDIGFHIEVNNQEIDAVECLLPLSKGDIVITPVVAGSKSGGAKILAAVAIAAFIFFNPAMFSTLGNMGGWGAAGATLNTQGLILAAVSANLALTGMQQLMAPDPATDQEKDEGYLFNGDARNVVEGDPVPLLYGELRVPGTTISVEVLPRKKYVTQNTHYSIENNDIVYDSAPIGEIIVGAGDEVNNYPGVKYSLSTAGINSNYGKNQDILVTHVISEGPIQGLVNGASSVYLDNDPGLDSIDSNTSLKGTNTKASLTNNNTSGTVNKPTSSTTTSSEDGATQNVKVYSAETTTATVSQVFQEVTFDDGFGHTYIDNYPVGIRLQTSGGFFSTDWIPDYTDFASAVKIRILYDNSTETAFESYITQFTNSNDVYIAWQGENIKNLTFGGASHTIAVDITYPGSVDENGNVNLNDNFDQSSGDYDVDITGTKESPDEGDSIFTHAKYKNFGVQFRTGHLYQTPLRSVDGEGVGNTGITQALGDAIVGPNNTGTNTYTYTDSQLGLSRAQAVEADEVSFLFNYGSLINYDEQGGDRPGKAWYTIQAAFSFDGTTYGNWVTTHELVKHYAQTSSTYTEFETVNLQQYRPAGAIGFRIKITRLTDNDKAYEEQRTAINTAYTSQTPSTIVSATTVLKEILTYPLTAMGKVQFNSENFSSLPAITYLCRGLKVSVPSNYVTREEASDGIAAYNRTPSTGQINSSQAYVDWDGNFRSEKVYTNNPAWVFYDIIVNNRYGLGTWLSQSDIDIYTLYRIGRYCDELVPDGAGGYEPRFTTNVYFTKASDAYKVLKDLATVFRGMLYWMDGQLVGVMDQASDPVYNFSPANIIDGQFNYESTGSKVRTNQIGVTWNNPAANYQQEVLLVEDPENIADTGKIVSESAVAFGATSEGQALRYGRWKLWTAKNQTELVSFKTAINAAFLRPGDIINIQDTDRRPPYQTLSGRISNFGTLNSTTIPLDRDITLQSGSTYELSVLIKEPGAFLSQTSATIDGNSYSIGELILTDNQSNPITTELAASNLEDDSNNPVQVVWKPYTRVETQTVITSAGNNITSLEVTTPFSTTPSVDTVWVLNRTISGVEVLGTKQEYKIIALVEDSINEYSITAIRHYNEKFDSVDNDFTLSLPDPIYPPELADDFVPAPKNVYLVPLTLGNDSKANDLVLYWDPPENADGTLYNKVAKYVFHHNISTIKQNPISLSSKLTSIGPYEVPPGSYSVSVSTISTSGKRSKPKKAFATVEKELTQKQVRRSKGVVLGGSSTSRTSLTSNNTFVFSNNNYTFIPAGNPTIEVEGDSNTAFTYSQDVSNIPSIPTATWQGYNLTEKLYAAHFILIDSSDTSDPIKLIKWYDDSTLGVGYFYDAGTGNSAASTYWTAATGTVNVTAGSSRVTGSGTSFSSDFQVGDYIKFGSSNVAKVAYIYSNTVLFLTKSFSSTITAATAYAPTLRIDRNDDAAIVGIRNVNNVFRLIPLPNFEVVDDPEGDGKAVVLTSDPDTIRFDSSGTLITTHSDITLTARALGFQNPEFKITGAGFSNSEITASAETTFTNNGTNAYSKTLDDITTYDADGLVFTVTVREKDSTSTTATTDLTISMLQDGQDGATGAQGPAGSTGDDGARNAIAYYFYSTAQSGAPSAPASSTFSYNFSTSTPSSSSGSWLTTFNPAALSSSNTENNKYWAIRVTFQEATFGGSVSVTLSSVFTWTNFDGLVTFTNLANARDEDGNLSTTLIDGGAITADTINVDSLKSNSAGNGSTFEFNTSGVDLGLSATLTSTGFVTSGTSNDIAYVGKASGSSQYGIGGIASGSGAGGVFHNTTNSDSYVLIAHSSYAFRMQDGNLNFQLDYTGNLETDGNITAYAGLGTPSDIRLKDDIQIIEGAVTKCMALRGVTFEYKKDKRRATGLIAQEVRRVLPEAVYETQTFDNSEENVLAINYGNMAGLFVEAIKELQNQISELKREVRRLKDGSPD